MTKSSQFSFVLFSFLVSLDVQAADLLLYGGMKHDDFLGCVNCTKDNPDSICNPYSATGGTIFDEYTLYGSKGNPHSPWNRWSSSTGVPVLVDREGNNYGYFTINNKRTAPVRFAEKLRKIYEDAKGDLTIVQKEFCERFVR